MSRGGARFLFVLGLGVFAVFGNAQAQQDPSYILAVSDTVGPMGSSRDLTVTLDNSGGDISGWSFGVCHDASALSLSGTPVDGVTTATVNGGGTPGFDAITAFPDGFTVGVVVDLMGGNFLVPGTGYELNVATYDLIGDPGDTTISTDVCFCNTLGSPPVATVVVVGGASIVPTQNCGTVDIVSPPPLLFHYVAASPTVPYMPATGVASFTTDLLIAEDSTSDSYPNDTQAFSMDIAYDGSIITATALEPAVSLAELNGGDGPDFYQANVTPPGGTGATVGVVYALLGGVYVQFTTTTPVVTLGFDTVPSALLGDMDGASTDLTWTDTLGAPPVTNVVVVGGYSIPPDLANGTITFEPVIDIPFRRGDCNDDGVLNVADAVWILNQLFQAGPEGPCAAACDVNSDDMLDQTDAIYVLNQQFLGGPNPAAPFPDCGTVPGAPCDFFGSCP